MRIHAIPDDETLRREVFHLCHRDPRKCAYTVITGWQFIMLGLPTLLFVTGLIFALKHTLTVFILLFNIGLLINVLFHGVVALTGAWRGIETPVSDDDVIALIDDDLPMYTILAPAYHEAAMVETLIGNLQALDYPKNKLQILLLLEQDDGETLNVVSSFSLPENVTIVIVPDGFPKTKPKACNVGLSLATGEYVTVFDVEDCPEPDQIKKAVVAFRRAPPNLFGVQAALNFSNVYDNFLTRMFTLEYWRWFGYSLVGLACLHLPIPLGGTSNHLRTSMLRELGGWDPHNVTEDVDLGIRAALNGYSISIINSTTYEQATNTLGNWIRQRSRWIKGYMQTGLVHLRHPVELVQRLGFVRTLSIMLLLAGTTFTYLFGPICGLLWFLAQIREPVLYVPPSIGLISMVNVVAGNGLIFVLNSLAISKRGYTNLIPFAFLDQVYWILHPLAAYKALWQLAVRPFFWEKTSKISRSTYQHLGRNSP